MIFMLQKAHSGFTTFAKLTTINKGCPLLTIQQSKRNSSKPSFTRSLFTDLIIPKLCLHIVFLFGTFI